MNDDYEIERWLVTLLMIIVALIFYFIAGKISTRTKYNGRVKFYLTIIVASIFSLLFFYPCAIIDDYYGIGNKYITAMALVFIPLSLLSLIIFSILFFINKSKF